jgi:hypothetical protein
MEVDALLILALSVHVGQSLEWWVLLLGLARYLLLVAQGLWPVLRGDLPSRRWRKVVAAIQGVVLVGVATGLLPRPVSLVLLVSALVLLAVSFLTEVDERLAVDAADAGPTRSSHDGRVLTALAVALVWVCLTAPSGGGELSPGQLARIPVEGIVLVGVAVLVPRRWADVLSLFFGLLAAVLVLVKALDVGFALVLDRSFDPVGDWGYLRPAVDVLADSVGSPLAWLAVVVVVGLALTLCVAVPLAARRITRRVARHPARSSGLAVGCTLVALALGVAGLTPSTVERAMSTASASLALEQAREVRENLYDRAVFAEAIADDELAAMPGDRLLRRLHGKDVLVVFVESYGRSAIEQGPYAPGVVATLDAGTRRLARSGYTSRSAFLTSPTFGAASWLAHATVQSGLWVDSQRRYDQLLSSDRLTLTRAFDQAGWRTVFDVPANTEDWPEGADFYGFDAIYDSRNVGYRGPRFGYAPVPDQYTLSRFRESELAPSQRPPVMAEIDLVSSHHPWVPLPRMVPWRAVGDGSVFDGMPEQAESAAEVLGDPDRVKRAYGRSVEYALSTLVSFLATYPDDDLVLLVLGDHEPHHFVSGVEPGHDVPVTLIARDRQVIADISGWGWSAGLRPATEAPVWRMDMLRDRFLDAFSAGP